MPPSSLSIASAFPDCLKEGGQEEDCCGRAGGAEKEVKKRGCESEGWGCQWMHIIKKQSRHKKKDSVQVLVAAWAKPGHTMVGCCRRDAPGGAARCVMEVCRHGLWGTARQFTIPEPPFKAVGAACFKSKPAGEFPEVGFCRCLSTLFRHRSIMPIGCRQGTWVHRGRKQHGAGLSHPSLPFLCSKMEGP